MKVLRENLYVTALTAIGLFALALAASCGVSNKSIQVKRRFSRPVKVAVQYQQYLNMGGDDHYLSEVVRDRFTKLLMQELKINFPKVDFIHYKPKYYKSPILSALTRFGPLAKKTGRLDPNKILGTPDLSDVPAGIDALYSVKISRTRYMSKQIRLANGDNANCVNLAMYSNFKFVDNKKRKLIGDNYYSINWVESHYCEPNPKYKDGKKELYAKYEAALAPSIKKIADAIKAVREPGTKK